MKPKKTMELKELIGEHKRIVDTLKNPTKKKLDAELKEQSEELASYKKEHKEKLKNKKFKNKTDIVTHTQVRPDGGIKIAPGIEPLNKLKKTWELLKAELNSQSSIKQLVEDEDLTPPKDEDVEQNPQDNQQPPSNEEDFDNNEIENNDQTENDADMPTDDEDTSEFDEQNPSDEEQSDEEQSDEEQSDEEQSDEEQSDEDEDNMELPTEDEELVNQMPTDDDQFEQEEPSSVDNINDHRHKYQPLWDDEEDFQNNQPNDHQNSQIQELMHYTQNPEALKTKMLLDEHNIRMEFLKKEMELNLKMKQEQLRHEVEMTRAGLNQPQVVK